ncbi:transposase [Komagataeibacter nataicola]|uniref:transposase n=1 Tax=Komagataeibacter nataicola TaxID=265960 RepID=UPI0028AF1BDE|nr:transposase [Komagataeibacter nataicola]WNM07561.1 transposase [Komagataeibacter nataicola]
MVIASYESRRPIREVAAQYGIHPSLVFRWRREARAKAQAKGGTSFIPVMVAPAPSRRHWSVGENRERCPAKPSAWSFRTVCGWSSTQGCPLIVCVRLWAHYDHDPASFHAEDMAGGRCNRYAPGDARAGVESPGSTGS